MAVVGIFDSGSGGLSVYRELVKVLPKERFVYYADNAHCPYGEKTAEYIQQRARFITDFLLSQGADIIVVAVPVGTAVKMVPDILNNRSFAVFGQVSSPVLPGIQRADALSFFIQIDDPVHLSRESDAADPVLFRDPVEQAFRRRADFVRVLFPFDSRRGRQSSGVRDRFRFEQFARFEIERRRADRSRAEVDPHRGRMVVYAHGSLLSTAPRTSGRGGG